MLIAANKPTSRAWTKRTCSSTQGHPTRPSAAANACAAGVDVLRAASSRITSIEPIPCSSPVSVVRWDCVDVGRTAAAVTPDPFIKPCEPTLRDRLSKGEGWLYEVKFDGYRVQIHKTGSSITLYMHNGAAALSAAHLAAARLRPPVHQRIIDAELVHVEGFGSCTGLCTIASRTICCCGASTRWR